MPVGPDKVRLNTTIDRKLADKIHALAERMKVSDSAMAYMLLEAAVDDEAWIVKAVTSAIGKKIGRALGLAGTDRKRFVEAEGDEV